MFTRTKPKTKDEEHVVNSQVDSGVLGGKPTDGSHRTITDQTKKSMPAAQDGADADDQQ